MITATPAAFAVTNPVFSFTSAISGRSLLHVTVLFVAVAGSTFAVRVSVVVSPIVRLAVFSSRVTPVTDTVAGFTVTVHVSV